MQSQKWQNDLCSFPRQTIQYHSNPSLWLTSNTEEAEVERFYEDLQDLSELTPKRDVLFIIGDWNAKVGSQETPGVTGKFGLGMWNEAGQRLIEFCQENALVIANTLFQQHKRRLYIWTSPDGQHQNQIDYILCSQRWRCYTVNKNKTRSWLWLRSWTPYYQIQTQIEESREKHWEKAMAPHSNTLAWKIPWTEKPGRL